MSSFLFAELMSHHHTVWLGLADKYKKPKTLDQREEWHQAIQKFKVEITELLHTTSDRARGFRENLRFMEENYTLSAEQAANIDILKPELKYVADQTFDQFIKSLYLKRLLK